MFFGLVVSDSPAGTVGPQLTKKMPADLTLELLLVEDSLSDAGLIQASLRLALDNVRVAHVDRLSLALDALATTTFTVVLLDLNLPDSTGMETFRQLSARSNGTPIVVLSGMEDSDTAIEAVGAGADDYVQKNHYDAHTLSRCVRFAIERNTRRSAERELINVRSQLASAQSIQDSLYPNAAPSIAGFDIAAGVRSAGIGCGDYYDFIALDDGRHVIVVGDVSGHGMASAIVMAETRACLRTLTDVKAKIQTILDTMNRLIYAGTSEGMFVTLVLVVYDPSSGHFEYFNAGHPGWIVRVQGDEQLITHQLPLGLLQDIDYSASSEFQLQKGDVLLLPTDGIAESSSETEMFGNQRVLDCVREKQSDASEAIVEDLFSQALDWSQTDVPADDMTVVILRAI